MLYLHAKRNKIIYYAFHSLEKIFHAYICETPYCTTCSIGYTAHTQCIVCHLCVFLLPVDTFLSLYCLCFYSKTKS